MAWEFEHDLVTINNLNHTLLLDLLIKRGQKRIFFDWWKHKRFRFKIEQPDVIVL